MTKLKKVRVQSVFIDGMGAVAVDFYDGFLSEDKQVVYWLEQNRLMVNTYLYNEMEDSFQANVDTEIHLATIREPESFDLGRATYWHRRLNSVSLLEYLVSESREIGGNDMGLGRLIQDKPRKSKLKDVI